MKQSNSPALNQSYQPNLTKNDERKHENKTNLKQQKIFQEQEELLQNIKFQEQKKQIHLEKLQKYKQYKNQQQENVRLQRLMLVNFNQSRREKQRENENQKLEEELNLKYQKIQNNQLSLSEQNYRKSKESFETYQQKIAQIKKKEKDRVQTQMEKIEMKNESFLKQQLKLEEILEQTIVQKQKKKELLQKIAQEHQNQRIQDLEERNYKILEQLELDRIKVQNLMKVKEAKLEIRKMASQTHFYQIQYNYQLQEEQKQLDNQKQLNQSYSSFKRSDELRQKLIKEKIKRSLINELKYEESAQKIARMKKVQEIKQLKNEEVIKSQVQNQLNKALTATNKNAQKQKSFQLPNQVQTINEPLKMKVKTSSEDHFEKKIYKLLTEEKQKTQKQNELKEQPKASQYYYQTLKAGKVQQLQQPQYSSIQESNLTTQSQDVSHNKIIKKRISNNMRKTNECCYSNTDFIRFENWESLKAFSKNIIIQKVEELLKQQDSNTQFITMNASLSDVMIEKYRQQLDDIVLSIEQQERKAMHELNVYQLN